ncbi:hypothetical protein EYC80_002379 [Monilinia laxa]|uniref:Uncharacterized protein n=1 Tax=Monilinia laxa TaxID=61186 RepID=A0A5N6K3Q0_MONLA|nr:hypothetical protein EYC80_002379 [Monilinia laxa]
MMHFLMVANMMSDRHRYLFGVFSYIFLRWYEDHTDDSLALRWRLEEFVDAAKHNMIQHELYRFCFWGDEEILDGWMNDCIDS